MKLWWQLGKQWLRAHWGLTLAAVLLAALTIFAGIGLLGVAGWFLTTAFLVGTLATFNVFIPSALVRGLSLLRIVSRYVERLVGHHVTLELQSVIRSQSFARIAALSPEELAHFRDGDLVARLVGDIDRLDTFFLLLFTPVIAGLLAGAFFSWVLGFFLPLMAWIVLLAVALAIVLIPYGVARRSAAAGQQVQEGFAQLRAMAHDSFVAHSDLAVFQAQDRVRSAFDAVLGQTAAASDRVSAQASLGTLLQQLLMGALVFLLLMLGGMAHASASMSAPMWVGLLFGLMGLFEVFAPVMRGAAELGAVHAASRRLHALQPQAAPQPVAPQHGITLPDTVQPLAVRGLGVSYGASPVLKNVYFDLPAGQRMVIQGLSGSGKTTLLLSLMQIIPHTGQVRYGGQDLSGVDPQVLYTHFALLSQHSPVFMGSVRYNLQLGDPAATDEALWSALQAVQLADHVKAMGGLDSWIGEGGNTLSVGQSRRLCLARIVLAPAQLWLLDEPTAGLDQATADALLQDLKQLARTRSMIVVTHAALPADFAHARYRLQGGVLLRQ